MPDQIILIVQVSFAFVEYICKDQSTSGKMYFEFIQLTVEVHNMQVICIVFIARIYIKQDKLLHMTRKSIFYMLTYWIVQVSH